ncbi:uncharacterized protein PHACADRAFT_194191 [Phanerochaete carnosa HHB-10118-sp]|uniref:Fungal-type protein kinase domain-containing protein n=1 Tax=Phanerochaete carnosa (strain HHB-10118-sp) TaxID=650164 RepID=K5VYD3_PHACS|nr:uncharacterized protein PHACADRAFT_194191 [Phanerochaete carnosa HHB-10118-sp]EKM56598.1 hypothetical protein PHACADRAFT_194191 [Phanerochaete carnosa HHB-10118-sp]
MQLEAYIRLHQHKVPYIATPIAGGDVDGQCTISQKYMTHLSEEWRPSKRVHIRLVTKEVGRLLETYKDSVELLEVCTCAYVAHKRAWENANILHRDVSVGNIMIDSETGEGFLNDWDLCKYREDMAVNRAASEPSGVSGTWAFKSALALRYPRKPPELADDLESFIHVITFFGYRFHHHELSSEPTDDTEDACVTANANNPELMGLISVFFYHQKKVCNGYYKGGGLKYHFILSGKPPVAFEPLKNGQRSLIETFLFRAYKLLQEHYWSLDESEYEEYAVQEGDCAALDEVDIPLPGGAPPRVSGMLEPPTGPYKMLWGDLASDIKENNGAFWTESLLQKPTCPFDDPQPVLGDHKKLGMLFLRFAVDERGNSVDLDSFRNDKRFDQFLSWKMICYLNRKGKTGQWKGNSSEEESKLKRKRDLEDTGDDDEAATPAKRHATIRTDGPITRALEKAEKEAAQAKVVAQQQSALPRLPTAQRQAASRRATTDAKTAPTRKSADSRPKKEADDSLKTSSKAKKAAKSQRTKAAVKTSASRKAQAMRKPSDPRRPATLTTGAAKKATVTASKTKAVSPPAPTRRSERLARKT